MTSHIGYMCMTDFEMDMPAYDAKVYASIDILRKERPCVDGCGIVQVEVKLVRVVQEPSESAEGCAPIISAKDGEGFAELFERHLAEDHLKRSKK